MALAVFRRGGEVHDRARVDAPNMSRNDGSRKRPDWTCAPPRSPATLDAARICSACGSNLDETARFCANCGADVTAHGVAPTHSGDFRKVCIGCASVNDSTSSFCLQCGLALPEASVPRDRAGGDPGGFWIRVAAHLIDSVVLNVATLLVARAAGVNVAPSLDSADVTSYGYLIVSVLLDLGYRTLMVGMWGRTLGKWALGLSVVNTAGFKLTYGRSFLRAVALYGSFFAFGLGILAMVLSPRKRGWHDLLAGSQVVRTGLN